MADTVGVSSLLDKVSAICVIAASLAVIWTVASTRMRVAADAGRGSGAPVEDVTDENLQIQLRSEDSVPPSARMAIVEFSDFQCPFCAKHARETLPGLKRDYVETAEVAYVFRSFPLEMLHPQAFSAAKAATCAARQAKFWEMHGWLFANQPALADDEADRGVAELRLDPELFASCLSDVTDQVREEMAEGSRLGVTATPTFFMGEVRDGAIAIRKRISGALPYAMFKAAIAELIES